MAIKRRNNLFLYLTLACFLGIILIFVFDGYMGFYDSITMDNGRWEQSIEGDQWQQQQDRYLTSFSAERGDSVIFTYTVDNRQFSAYAANVEVTAWHNQEKLADLAAATLSVPSFGRQEVEWSLDIVDLIPADYPTEQSYNVNVVIQRGDIEREVVIYIGPGPYPTKTVIIEQPPSG